MSGNYIPRVTLLNRIPSYQNLITENRFYSSSRGIFGSIFNLVRKIPMTSRQTITTTKYIKDGKKITKKLYIPLISLFRSKVSFISRYFLNRLYNSYVPKQRTFCFLCSKWPPFCKLDLRCSRTKISSTFEKDIRFNRTHLNKFLFPLSALRQMQRFHSVPIKCELIMLK